MCGLFILLIYDSRWIRLSSSAYLSILNSVWSVDLDFSSGPWLLSRGLFLIICMWNSVSWLLFDSSSLWILLFFCSLLWYWGCLHDMNEFFCQSSKIQVFRWAFVCSFYFARGKSCEYPDFLVLICLGGLKTFSYPTFQSITRFPPSFLSFSPPEADLCETVLLDCACALKLYSIPRSF